MLTNRQSFLTSLNTISTVSQKGFDSQYVKQNAFSRDQEFAVERDTKSDPSLRQAQLKKQFFPNSRKPLSDSKGIEKLRDSGSSQNIKSGQSKADIAPRQSTSSDGKSQPKSKQRPSNSRRIKAMEITQAEEQQGLSAVSNGHRKIQVVEDLAQEFQIRQASYQCVSTQNGGKTLYDGDERILGSFSISQNSNPSNIDIKITHSDGSTTTFVVDKAYSIEQLESAIPSFKGKSTILTENGLSIYTSENTYILISKDLSGIFSARFMVGDSSYINDCLISPDYDFDVLLANSSSSLLNSSTSSQASTTSTTPEFSTTSTTPKVSSTSTSRQASTTSTTPEFSTTSTTPKVSTTSTSRQASTTTSTRQASTTTTTSTSVAVIPTTTPGMSSMYCILADTKISGMKSLTVYSSNSDDGFFVANLKYKIENNIFFLEYSRRVDGKEPEYFTIDFSRNASSRHINIVNTPYSFDIKQIGSSFQIGFNEDGKISASNCIIGQNFTTITTSTTTKAPTSTTSTTPFTTSTTTKAPTSTTSTTPFTTTTTPFITNTTPPVTNYTTTSSYNDSDPVSDFKSCRLENNSKFIISNSFGQRIQTIDLTNSSTEPKIKLNSTEFNPFNFTQLQSLKAQGVIANFFVEGSYSNITLNSGVFLESVKTANDVRYSVYDVANATRVLGTCQASLNLTKSIAQPTLSANYSCQKTANGLQISKQNYQDQRSIPNQKIASLSFENVSNNIQVNASLNDISVVFSKGNLEIRNSNNTLLYKFSSGGILSYKHPEGHLNREFTNPYMVNVSGVYYKLNVSGVDIQNGKISYSLVDSNNNGFSLTRSNDNGETINASSIIEGEVNSQCSSSNYIARSIQPELPQEYHCQTQFEDGVNKMTIYSPKPQETVLGAYQIYLEGNQLKIKDTASGITDDKTFDLLTFQGQQVIKTFPDNGKLLSVMLQKKPNSNEFQLTLENNQTLIGGCSIEKNATATPTICIKQPNGSLYISSVDGDYLLTFGSRKIADEGLPYQIFRFNGSQQTPFSSGNLTKAGLNFSTGLSLNATTDVQTGLYKVEVLDSGKNISGACSFYEPEISPEYNCQLVDVSKHSSNSSTSNSSDSLSWKKRFILSRSQLQKPYREMPVSFNSSGIIEFEIGSDSAGNQSKIIFDISSSDNVVKLQSSNSTRYLRVNETIAVQGINYTYRVDENKNPYIESDEKLVIKPSVVSLNASSPNIDRVYNISITQDSRIVGNCSYDANGKIISSIVGNDGVYSLPSSTITTTLFPTPSITSTTLSSTQNPPIPIANASKLFEGLCELAEGKVNQSEFDKEITKLAKNCSRVTLENYNSANISFSDKDVSDLCSDIQSYSQKIYINATNPKPPANATLGEINKLKQSINDRLKCVQHSGNDNQKSIIIASVFGAIGVICILGGVYALRKRDKLKQDQRRMQRNRELTNPVELRADIEEARGRQSASIRPLHFNTGSPPSASANAYLAFPTHLDDHLTRLRPQEPSNTDAQPLQLPHNLLSSQDSRRITNSHQALPPTSEAQSLPAKVRTRRRRSLNPAEQFTYQPQGFTPRPYSTEAQAFDRGQGGVARPITPQRPVGRRPLQGLSGHESGHGQR